MMGLTVFACVIGALVAFHYWGRWMESGSSEQPERWVSGDADDFLSGRDPGDERDDEDIRW
jgi:hypothetical protein